MTATVEGIRDATVITSDGALQPPASTGTTPPEQAERPKRRSTPWTETELLERAARIAASFPPFTTEEAKAAGRLAAMIDAKRVRTRLNAKD